MNIKRIAALAIGLFVLAIAIGLTVGMKYRQKKITRHANLLTQLPSNYPGWEVKDMPIASTPEMQKAVDEMLNYDEAVFREYSRNGKTLTVYAAYWRPFRFHPRLISIHTPDICWVGNGWIMRSSNYNYEVNLPGSKAWHAQERVFEAGGVPMNVIYWHILDSRLSGYAEGPKSASRSFMRNFINDLKHGAGEQFFIRISSAQPWSSWVDDPLYKEILNTFSPVLKAVDQ